jgi:hypothetical protein
MNLDSISYARILWHRAMPGVGHLELVCAVPFGPLARKQRLVLQDVDRPDEVLALVRGAEPSPHAGDAELPLTDRLDPDEEVLWGGSPEGPVLGWRELATAAGGVVVTLLGLAYGYRAGGILLGLEQVGLPVRSWEWTLLFAAVAITWGIMLAVGLGLVWYGVLRARRLGHETEYVVTDRRLLIRRGTIELSVDRRRIVDVVDAPASRGLHHLFLLLDAPHSRALGVSGALGPLLPSRDPVPPVLYDLRDIEPVKRMLLGSDVRRSRPSVPGAA